VLVYAGAIMVLFLFVIMLVNLREPVTRRVRLHATVSGLAGLGVLSLILYVYSRGSAIAAGPGQPALRQGGNLQAIGWTLYREYLLPFEIASILLLVAMIGAIVLARHKA
jgi:NADH-quinone oxidoreductase subunit J